MIRSGFLLLLLLLAPATARAECQREERAAMARQGYTAPQINAVCELTEEDFPEPAAGTAAYCETGDSFCPLDAPTSIGTPCTCATQYGTVTGVAE
ncbi:MAG: hypothetical protein ACREEV_11740 [Dongiaceae bacterium]